MESNLTEEDTRKSKRPKKDSDTKSKEEVEADTDTTGKDVSDPIQEKVSEKPSSRLASVEVEEKSADQRGRRGKVGKLETKGTERNSQVGEKLVSAEREEKNVQVEESVGNDLQSGVKTSSRRGRKTQVKPQEVEIESKAVEKAKEKLSESSNEKPQRGRNRRKMTEDEEKEQTVTGEKKKEDLALQTEEIEVAKPLGKRGRKAKQSDDISTKAEAKDAENTSQNISETDSQTPSEASRSQIQDEKGVPRVAGRRGRKATLKDEGKQSPSVDQEELNKPTSSRQVRGKTASATPSESQTEELEGKGETAVKIRSKRGAKKVPDADKKEDIKNPIEKKSTRVSRASNAVTDEAGKASSFQPPAAKVQSSRGRKRVMEEEEEGAPASSQGTPKKQKLAAEKNVSSQPSSPKRRGRISNSQESSQDATPISKKPKPSPAPTTPHTPSRRDSLSSSQQQHAASNSPSLRKSTTDYKPRVMFTGVIDQKGEKIVKDMGGELATTIQRCTHLVTDKIRRTVKFLGGLAKGVPIVTPQWLENCKRVGTFLDGHPFLVKDPAIEKQFGFSLAASLVKAQSGDPIFQDYQIHVTKSVKPDPLQMKDILDCAGAEFLPRMPSKSGDKTVVISCTEDEKVCKAAMTAGIPIVGVEFVLTGILRQEVDLDAHALFTTKPSQATGKGKAKR